MPKFEAGLQKNTILRACQLADTLEKQKANYSITLYAHSEFELDRAREVWAGFQEGTAGLIYKNVMVVKV